MQSQGSARSSQNWKLMCTRSQSFKCRGGRGKERRKVSKDLVSKLAKDARGGPLEGAIGRGAAVQAGRKVKVGHILARLVDVKDAVRGRDHVLLPNQRARALQTPATNFVSCVLVCRHKAFGIVFHMGEASGAMRAASAWICENKGTLLIIRLPSISTVSVRPSVCYVKRAKDEDQGSSKQALLVAMRTRWRSPAGPAAARWRCRGTMSFH